ncbi:MAG: primosomal protein N' [Hydrococcus sp. C42_A2020_068]|nr:primosomal protein N' [Hydrococcus sp. C42_A2020_068]
MSDTDFGLVVAEPSASYQFGSSEEKWLEVLVDCPGVQGLYTYRLPSDLAVKPGDIVSVPFGSQILGGIAIGWVKSPSADLDPSRIREVEDVISAGFFPSSYWQLLNRVAEYYCTDLMAVIKSALPPGLLGRSQRRIRLRREALPQGAETFCSPSAGQILRLLKSQKEGDYSAQYLQRQIRNANRGIRELVKRGWVESYLEPPKTTRPKLQKAVTLIVESFPIDLTQRQREVLEVLRHRGGELWLNELLQLCKASSAIVDALASKGCIVIQQRERLRLLNEEHPTSDTPKTLTQDQAEALATIRALEGFAQVLLHGVTGSGKTEVYLQAIAPILESGKSALVLVPEIGLTPQLTDRFRARFGHKVCVYHSALSDGERYDTWRQMLAGEPQIVIGTRSAIFAPLPKLGSIVLDEEHDSSFKQTQLLPTYHARTVAKWRAELEDCLLILGSATPSLESWVEVRSHKEERKNLPIPKAKSYYLSLPQRIQSRPLPPVEIVDMRRELQIGNRSIFSRSLQEALESLQQRQQKAILFINRRGHSTFVSCRSCGYVMECPHCDVSLSYHYTHEGATELLRCHYCNYSCLQPRNCPECGSPYLKFFGSGTQKVTQELTQQFPKLRWIRFDSDTTRTKGAHRTLLSQFARGEADVLVGTQMLTKGLDLDRVTLVGIVSADGLLHHSDYRASERAFQTLTQVAGRAGRGDEPGRVIVQTYSPDHPVIQAVRRHDYDNFVEVELSQREALHYPPYGRLVLIRLSGIDGVEVQNSAQSVADACTNLLNSDCEILGPAPANIMRVARRYRWHILLKFAAEARENLLILNELRNLCPQSVSLSIDVDPLSID